MIKYYFRVDDGDKFDMKNKTLLRMCIKVKKIYVCTNI